MWPTTPPAGSLCKFLRLGIVEIGCPEAIWRGHRYLAGPPASGRSCGEVADGSYPGNLQVEGQCPGATGNLVRKK